LGAGPPQTRRPAGGDVLGGGALIAVQASEREGQQGAGASPARATDRPSGKARGAP
jgi:hypothetical protein